MLRNLLARRATVFKICGVALAFCVVTTLVWRVLVPHYRPALRPGEVYGIDVSSHQQPLDWQQVAADNIAFAYIKATEGSSTEDPLFAVHWQGAKQAGLRVGGYHYFSLCSPGRTQAENFLRTVPVHEQTLPPALDLEFSPHCHDQPSRDEVLKQIQEYLNLVQAATKKQPILYVGKSFDNKYHIRQQYPDHKYWQLRYLRRTTTARDYIWQAGNFFRVDGTSELLDLNVANINDL